MAGLRILRMYTDFKSAVRQAKSPTVSLPLLQRKKKKPRTAQ